MNSSRSMTHENVMTPRLVSHLQHKALSLFLITYCYAVGAGPTWHPCMPQDSIRFSRDKGHDNSVLSSQRCVDFTDFTGDRSID
ncbi:hypothetical protein BV898_03643 [Hypsibius exemplaris]|uniref:Uncharacterized protein n=1 Tax=Hypsibius exemplaris TaxID=2072580 RepID=A0A1W0X558_HYPEX|nr:hypothetical protein BV898_03643 [Hypsibius exemplaris]